jgi:ABC-type phosphate transport system substrate-binding protein
MGSFRNDYDKVVILFLSTSVSGRREKERYGTFFTRFLYPNFDYNDRVFMNTRLTKILVSGAIVLAYPLAARADTFPEPTTVPTGTTIAIDGSSSLATANQALKKRFEERYPGAKVNINYGGSDSALRALENGSIDIAAIGRPLTDAERAEGFKTIALPRRKIAIVIGPENPFRGTLSARQFAGIVRGELPIGRRWVARGEKSK